MWPRYGSGRINKPRLRPIWEALALLFSFRHPSMMRACSPVMMAIAVGAIPANCRLVTIALAGFVSWSMNFGTVG
jgi:hypothetical protein